MRIDLMKHGVYRPQRTTKENIKSHFGEREVVIPPHGNTHPTSLDTAAATTMWK